MGEILAESRGLKCSLFPADWEKYGRKAGYLRNDQMARYTDVAIILWDGQSRGTKHMIDLMMKYDKPCDIHIIKNGILDKPNHFEESLFWVWE